jgi:hypothetical protein
MLLDESFDLDSLPTSQPSFEPIPAGWYMASINSAEIRPTKSGGKMIALKYEVLGPTHAGRFVFGNINIRNSNPKAEEIGRQQLGDIMRAIGLSRLSDTDDFIGGKLSIKVQVTQSEQYGPGNEIRGWKAIEGSSIPRPTMPTSAPSTPSSAGAPPWAKK